MMLEARLEEDVGAELYYPVCGRYLSSTPDTVGVQASHERAVDDLDCAEAPFHWPQTPIA